MKARTAVCADQANTYQQINYAEKIARWNTSCSARGCAAHSTTSTIVLLGMFLISMVGAIPGDDFKRSDYKIT